MSEFENPIRTWIGKRAKERGGGAELMRQANASKSAWYKYLDGKDALSDTVIEWALNLGFEFIPPGENAEATINPDNHITLQKLQSENAVLKHEFTHLTEKYELQKKLLAALENREEEGRAISLPSSESRTSTNKTTIER